MLCHVMLCYVNDLLIIFKPEHVNNQYKLRVDTKSELLLQFNILLLSCMNVWLLVIIILLSKNDTEIKI